MYNTLDDNFNFMHLGTSTQASTPLSANDIPSKPDHPLPCDLYISGQVLTRMASNLMSMQTSAAHGHTPTNRPGPMPMQQNVLWTNGDSSSDSSDSGQSPIEIPPRCSRCQRTPSIDIQTGKSNMVSYGLNNWYCSRCAALVGFKR